MRMNIYPDERPPVRERPAELLTADLLRALYRGAYLVKEGSRSYLVEGQQKTWLRRVPYLRLIRRGDIRREGANGHYVLGAHGYTALEGDNG
jgi:hypothetical protein